MTNFDKWRFFHKDYESPDSFIEWGYIFMIAAALQRRVWLYGGSARLHPNLIIIYCGPPAVGKGRIITSVKQVMKSPIMIIERVKPNGDKVVKGVYPFGADSTTFQKMLIELAKCKDDFEYELNGQKYVESHMSCCFTISEMATMMRNSTCEIVNLIHDLYDCQDHKYETKNSPTVDVVNSCVSMLFATNPAFIHEALEMKILEQGFFSRCIMVVETDKRFCRHFPGLSNEQMIAFLDVMNHIKSLHKVCGEMKFTPEADEFMKTFYESGEFDRQRGNLDYKLNEYYGRKRTMWFKLCMIMNFLEQSENIPITLDICKQALMVLTKLEPKMSLAFNSGGRNYLFEMQTNILKFLEAKHTQDKTGASRKLLLLKFSVDGTVEEIDSCISFLQNTEQTIYVGNELRLKGKVY